jgi:hypothetical protein
MGRKMSERADLIQRRILQIEDRLHQLAVQLKQLEGKPYQRPRFIGILLELSRRPALEEERDALIERRSKLEREYDSLPEPLKS